MSKVKQVNKAKVVSNQKYIIIAAAIVLAAIGYYGYRSLLVIPDINKIDVGGNSKGDKTKPSQPRYRMEPVNKNTGRTRTN